MSCCSRFQVYYNRTELISEYISEFHWWDAGFNEQEIVIDSNGKMFKLSKEHYDENTKTLFPYPSILMGDESLDNLKKRVVEGCNDYLEFINNEDEESIKTKIEILNKINSFKELIVFVDKELVL